MWGRIKRRCDDLFEIDPEGIWYRDTMRTLTAVMLLLAVIEFILGVYVFSYLKDVHWGSWWAALFIMLTAVFGLSSANKNIVYASIWTSVISVLFVGSAVIVDGIGWTQFAILDGCYDLQTGEGKGNKACLSISYDDMEVPPQCVCSDDTFCHSYTLNRGDDCASILTTYTHTLASSFAFCLVLFVLVSALSVTACLSVCCEPPEERYEAPSGGHFPRIEMSTMIVDSPMIPIEELDGTEVEAIIDSVY